jgi:hypothetical protein
MVLLDVTSLQLLEIAGEHISERYRRALQRYRHGPGVFKVDLALDGPIPWRAEGCKRAATVHLGCTLDEISEGERAVWRGEPPERQFVLRAPFRMGSLLLRGGITPGRTLRACRRRLPARLFPLEEALAA